MRPIYLAVAASISVLQAIAQDTETITSTAYATDSTSSAYGTDSATASTTSQGPRTQTVSVGYGGFTFVPDTIQAAVGDTVGKFGPPWCSESTLD